MPVEFKDYYKVLGVGRTASHDDIRKAFRKLARQYHPDVAKDKKRAEEKFKEINEAYEVLGDAEKRKKYDDLGADWKDGGARWRPGAGGGNFRTHSWRGGPGEENYQFGGTGFSDFFEQFFGGGFGRRHAPAEAEPEKGQDVEGIIMVTLEEAMRGVVRPITLRRNTLCGQCGGSGAKGKQVCPACGGAGQVSVTQNYKVKIPAGVRDGQRLRVSGQGEPGLGGGPPGDLYLRVRMASHPDFRVEGGDLYYELDLAPWEGGAGRQRIGADFERPGQHQNPARHTKRPAPSRARARLAWARTERGRSIRRGPHPDAQRSASGKGACGNNWGGNPISILALEWECALLIPA